MSTRLLHPYGVPLLLACLIVFSGSSCGTTAPETSLAPGTYPSPPVETTEPATTPPTSAASTATTSTVPWATTTLPGATTPTATTITSSTTTTRPPATTAPSTTKPATTTSPPPTVPGAGKEYVRLPGDTKRVALTFDAAYDTSPLRSILGTLSRERVPATFFFTGEFVETFPAAVASVVASGSPIGNHSYSHPDFTTLSTDEARYELRHTAALLTGAGAADPRPLFRFPYGARDPTVLAFVGSEGYYSIYWTIDTLDWKVDRTVEEIRTAVRIGLTPGAIILMHVGGAKTAEALPLLIADIRARGYTFTDLRSALP